MKLSIVTTLYYSAAYIEEFYRRISARAQQMTDDYEIIFVNDGSPDNSLEVAMKVYEADKKVKIIDLSRNFGHHKAIMAGLAHAVADYIFLIDVDLEEEPEWLLDFYQHMQRMQCDVVYGVQKQRKGGFVEKISGSLAYSLFNSICNIRTPRNLVTARIMTMRYKEALLSYTERELVLSALWVMTGFDQQPIEVNKFSSSPTSYSLSRKLSHTVSMITSFSSLPLTFIFYTGMTIFLLSVTYAAYLIVNKIFFQKPLGGWTSLMVSIWLLGGMVISFVGVIGVYLSKIFLEVKQRPNTIIKKIYEQ